MRIVARRNPNTCNGWWRKNGADVGIALDGDGDRVMMVDEKTQLIDGDQIPILYVMSGRRVDNGSMPGGVVGTVMTNFGLELACQARGIPFARAAVGDRHVHEMLRQRGWILGGETSGHILCLEKSTTGDGIIAALDVLESMITKDQPLSALTSAMEVFPQTNINVSLKTAGSPQKSR